MFEYYQIKSRYYRLGNPNLCVVYDTNENPPKHEIILAVYRPTEEEIEGIKKAMLKGAGKKITQEIFDTIFTITKKLL